MPKTGLLPQTSQTDAMRRPRSGPEAEPGEDSSGPVDQQRLGRYDARRWRLSSGWRALDLRLAITRFRDALRAHQDELNRLNVYPVPDGDTGTNMTLTLESVVNELGSAEDMVEVCQAVAHGSLMGARGNSGVILSQVLRGLADMFRGLEAVGCARSRDRPAGGVGRGVRSGDAPGGRDDPHRGACGGRGGRGGAGRG